MPANLPYNGTILKLIIVQYGLSSALEGIRGASCVSEEASSNWITAFLTLVSALMLNANCPVGTDCYIAKLYIAKFYA